MPPIIDRVPLVGCVKFRPLAKNSYVASPWCDYDVALNSKYIPSRMTVLAVKKGLAKAHDGYFTIDEEIATYTERYLINEMKSIWLRNSQDNLTSWDDAVSQLKRDKSAGFPYFYYFKNKGEVIDKGLDEVHDRVNSILSGSDVPSFFAGTLKSELRPFEKVALSKTRVFMASDMHHLLASKILYEVQNLDLMMAFGQHPITLGIQIPGSQFVRLLCSFAPDCFDGDVDGCDLRFILRVARSICSIRHHFLPSEFALAGHHLYSQVYCGFIVILGGLYRLMGNKSGWENTAHDNSFFVWWMFVYLAKVVFPTYDFKDIMKVGINSDDIVAGSKQEFFMPLIEEGRKLNFLVEVGSHHAQSPSEIVFLSHHLRERFVPMFGDFVLAAGNLPKLLSSVNWVKRNNALTFEESCVTHLIGLRLCLFPWAIEFEKVDSILSTYLLSITLTPFMRQALKARLSEHDLAVLHTRCEFSGFLSHNSKWLDQVLNDLGSPDKSCVYEDDEDFESETPKAFETTKSSNFKRFAACSTSATEESTCSS